MKADDTIYPFSLQPKKEQIPKRSALPSKLIDIS
jgi:hypothetical protein